MLQSVLDGLLTVDERGEVRSVNLAGAQMFGFEEREIIGQSIAVLLPDLGNVLWQRLAQNERDQVKTLQETVALRKDGARFPVELSASGMTVGDLRTVVVLVRDISERTQIQARLMLTDRMVSMGTVAAGVAHEINNPLQFITGNVKFAIKELSALSKDAVELGAATLSAEKVADLMDALKDAVFGAERVRKIVRELQTFTRADDERHVPVEIRRVLESSVHMAAAEIKHRARIVREYTATPLVQGIESKLGQVFLNLLINAAPSIPEGNVEKNCITVATHVDF